MKRHFKRKIAAYEEKIQKIKNKGPLNIDGAEAISYYRGLIKQIEVMLEEG